MLFSFRSRRYGVLLIVCFLPVSLLWAQNGVSEGDKELFDPVGLYLTWQQDPSTTMTIDWHTTADEERPSVVEYRTKGASTWKQASGDTRPFPYSERTIHRVELTDLDPDTYYEFRFGEDAKSYLFRTMPDRLTRPIRIAFGGDTMHVQGLMDAMNRQVVKYDPDFAAVGGDLSYADGLPPEEQRIRADPETRERIDPRPELEEGDNLWYHWFDSYKNTLVTDEGRVIPMVVAIGNHEVVGGYHDREYHERREGFPPYEQTDEIRELFAPYFFGLFAFPGQPGYNVLDFGDYMSVILLDTDHANPIEGEQAAWLEEVLAERQHVPHVFPMYHLPAYPSVRNYEEGEPRIAKTRDVFVPLFEQYGVRVAFENHDHAYKRTHPIREGEIRSDGIVYIGDGSWGTVPRDVKIGGDADGIDWYLKKAQSVIHAIVMTIDGPHQHMLMVDIDGNIIDEYPETPHRMREREEEEAVPAGQ